MYPVALDLNSDYHSSVTDFYIIIGLVMLVGAIGAALKIGLWMWIASAFFGRQTPAPSPASSTADNLKKWLTIVATILGIVSTSVGLLEKCGNSGSQNVTPSYVPETRMGIRCCTSIGACPMMTGAQPVGSVCTCMGMAGFVQGRICQ